jgi:SAM-dependent methyltransferase
MKLLTRAQRWSADRFGYLLSIVYYEYCFDRPAGRVLASRVERWERRRGTRDVPVPESVWNQCYGQGQWAFLRELRELGRYSLVVGYLRELKPDGAVIDVGCGEGLLFERLHPYGCTRYLGLDISIAALEKTQAARASGGLFVCADAESFVPPAGFDAIVFNETLYYFRQPLDAVARYLGALDSGGVAIVSTYLGSRRARAILRALFRRHRLIDETRVSHGTQSWSCAVFAA